MMLYLVCSIYDRKLDQYATNTLLLFSNDDIAKRAIHAVVLDESTEYSRYASDFSLWHVGTFDVTKGVMLECERRKVCEFDMFKTMGA